MYVVCMRKWHGGYKGKQSGGGEKDTVCVCEGSQSREWLLGLYTRLVFPHKNKTYLWNITSFNWGRKLLYSLHTLLNIKPQTKIGKKHTTQKRRPKRNKINKTSKTLMISQTKQNLYTFLWVSLKQYRHI